MTASDPQGSAARPRHVMDPFGNIWQHYNDVGYVRLVSSTDPAFKTVEDLVAWVGPVAIVEAKDAD